MDVLIHNDQPLEKWREGVMTRMRMSALLGSRQLCIFDQFCDPGLGAPIHSHAVEEVLVRDNKGQALSYVYYKSQDARVVEAAAVLDAPRTNMVAPHRTDALSLSNAGRRCFKPSRSASSLQRSNLVGRKPPSS